MFRPRVKRESGQAPVPLHEDRFFQYLVMISSGLGMGGVVSSLTLLSSGPHGFEFHWTNLAYPAFALGAVVSTVYWRLVFRLTSRSTPSSLRFLAAASGGMLVFALAAFLYPIRFIPQQKRADVIFGLAAAVLVLGTIGYIVHSIVRWLEQDAQEDPPPGSEP